MELREIMIYRLNNKHNWGETYMTIWWAWFLFLKISSKNYEESVQKQKARFIFVNHLIQNSSHVSYPKGEVGYSEKDNHLRPIHLEAHIAYYVELPL